MPDVKELGIESGMHIAAVCQSLLVAAPASTVFNGVRLTTRVGDTAETLRARWEAQFRVQHDEDQRKHYQARVARVCQIISSTASAEEAAYIIVDALRPMEHYGR